MINQKVVSATPEHLVKKFRQEIQLAESEKNNLRLSQLHTQFAQMFFDHKNYLDGNDQLDLAIKIAKEIGDKNLEAQILGLKGNLYVEANQMDGGYVSFEKVLEIAREINNPHLESDALGSMGMVHLDTGDPAAAIEKYSEALTLAKEVGDRKREMNFLSGLGNIYLNIAAEEEALRYFQQAYEISLELEDEQAQAGFQNNIGIIRKNASDNKEALKLFESVRKLTNKLNDPHGELNALRNLINIYSEENQNIDLILVYLRRAIHLSQQFGDYPSEVTYYDALILVLLSLNRNQEALEMIENALQDERLSEFPERKMQLLVNRGNANFDSNQYQLADQAYRQALEASVRMQNKNMEARVLGRLGAVQAEMGYREAAVEFAQQSLAKAEALEDQRIIVEQYCMLALTNQELGKLPDAKDYCEKALEMFSETSISPLKEKIAFLLEELNQQLETA